MSDAPQETGSQGTGSQEAAVGTAVATGDEKTMGMLCHLLGLCGFIGPLVIWLIKKDQMPFVASQGKEALNFQITVAIAWIACIPLMFVLIGIFLFPLVVLADLVLIVLASITTSRGQPYRYPFAIRLIK